MNTAKKNYKAKFRELWKSNRVTMSKTPNPRPLKQGANQRGFQLIGSLPIMNHAHQPHQTRWH